MPCYHPLTAYRSKLGRDSRTGKWPIVFNVTHGYADLQITVPCGQCIGCRLEKSRQWAIRCVHEASLYVDNCFLTLTYMPQSLPRVVNTATGEILNSLNGRDYQLFMKRLRKRYGEGIRFFQCGEYGENFDRPHHHAILFNFDFKDKYLWSVRNGSRLYRSPSLEELWPHGFSSIGHVTFESAAYVARYITKKISGNLATHHYDVRKPEFITMSRRPGIGQGWFKKFSKEVYPSDQCYIRPGLISRPPRYYDNKFDLLDPECFANIKLKRRRAAMKLSDSAPERLAVKERIQLLKFQKLIRPFETYKEV